MQQGIECKDCIEGPLKLVQLEGAAAASVETLLLAAPDHGRRDVNTGNLKPLLTKVSCMHSGTASEVHHALHLMGAHHHQELFTFLPLPARNGLSLTLINRPVVGLD